MKIRPTPGVVTIVLPVRIGQKCVDQLVADIDAHIRRHCRLSGDEVEKLEVVMPKSFKRGRRVRPGRR